MTIGDNWFAGNSTMSNGTVPNKAVPKLTWAQKTLAILVVGGTFLSWNLWTGTSPIPTGRQNREKAAVFLKDHFPNRVLSPGDSATAPVAAVFHLIREGDPASASRAIRFSAEQEFGFATPYVIERLGSGDPELQRAALAFLRKISGEDLGSDAAAWKAWWRDPPRNLLGIAMVGHHTVEIAIPIVAALIGVTLLLIGGKPKREAVLSLAVALLAIAWFISIAEAGFHLVGSFDTCTFGTRQITYHSNHGAVIGLEDAKVGGAGLWILLIPAFLLIPLLIGIVYIIVVARKWPLTNAEVESRDTKSNAK